MTHKDKQVKQGELHGVQSPQNLDEAVRSKLCLENPLQWLPLHLEYPSYFLLWSRRVNRIFPLPSCLTSPITLFCGACSLFPQELQIQPHPRAFAYLSLVLSSAIK